MPGATAVRFFKILKLPMNQWMNFILLAVLAVLPKKSSMTSKNVGFSMFFRWSLHFGGWLGVLPLWSFMIYGYTDIPGNSGSSNSNGSFNTHWRTPRAIQAYRQCLRPFRVLGLLTPKIYENLKVSFFCGMRDVFFSCRLTQMDLINGRFSSVSSMCLLCSRWVAKTSGWSLFGVYQLVLTSGGSLPTRIEQSTFGINFGTRKVAELKQALESAGLPVTGKKAAPRTLLGWGNARVTFGGVADIPTKKLCRKSGDSWFAVVNHDFDHLDVHLALDNRSHASCHNVSKCRGESPQPTRSYHHWSALRSMWIPRTSTKSYGMAGLLFCWYDWLIHI